jgi:hypothetical protein
MTQETISIISSLIAAVTGIAALVTAIATILTARQIKKQREASYRPELAFSETRLYGYGSDGSGGIPATWSETEIADYKNLLPVTSWYDLRLYNIGFGTAKNVEVSWDFPVSQMVEHVNVLAQRALQPAYHKYENGTVSLDSTKFPEINQIWSNQRRGNRIGYLLPTNINKDGVAVHIPPAFIHLGSCWLYFVISTDYRSPLADIDKIPPLTVDLHFEDMAGEPHRKSYNLYLEVHSITRPYESNMMKFEGQITVRDQRENSGRRKLLSHALDVMAV